MLQRRVHGRYLGDFTPKGFKALLELLQADSIIGTTDNIPLGITAICFNTQANGGSIGLVSIEKKLGKLGGFTKA